MKLTILFSALLVFSNSFATTLETIVVNDNNGLHNLSVGITVAEAINKVKEDCFIEKNLMPGYEGKQYEYIVYCDQSKSSVLYSFNAELANQTKERVLKIAIKNSSYKTIDGITVGMTIKDIKEKAQLIAADFSYEIGLFIPSNTFNGGYLMDIYPLVESNYNYEKPDIHNLPDNLRIKEIVLF